MDLNDPTAIVITSAAGVGAIVYLGTKLLGLARAVLAIQAIVERELEHNHGSSMKDDIYGMARSLGEVQRQLSDFEDALRRQHPEDPLFRNPGRKNR